MTKDKDTLYQLPQLLNRSRALEVIILFLVFGIYANTLNHNFTQDDAIVIYENIYVQDGLQGLKRIFTTDSFSGFFGGEDKSSLVAGGRYRPMTIAIFACIYHFYGDNPFVYHLLNVLFYAVLCIVIFWTIRSFSGLWAKKKLRFFAFMATLIYAVHPIHTEAVANVKGLDEIFSFLFSLLSLLCAVYFARTQKIGFLVLMVLSFIIALLSKENAAAFLVIIPLVVFYFSGKTRHKSKAFVLLGVLLVTFIGYWVLRMEVLGNPEATSPAEMMNNPFIKIEDGRYVPFSTGERWASIIYGMGKYIQLLFFPHPLTHDYYPRHFGVASFSQLAVWAALAMNLALAIIAIVGIKRKSFTTFLIFFFYVTIALMSNVAFPIGTHLSERFLFTPSFSIALFGAYGLTRLKEITKYQSSIWWIFAFIIFAGALKTIVRNNAWKDDLTLFTTDVKVSKNSAKVRNAAGGALLSASIDESDEELKRSMISQGIVHLTEAVKIHPNYKEAHLLLGNAYSYLKHYDQSINSYDNALRINPYYDQAEKNLLIVLREGAREVGGIQRDFPKAIQYLQRALIIDPNNFESLALMGTAMGSSGDHMKAIQYFEQAISINPNIATTYVNLGFAQLNAGMEEDAQINFSKAVQIDPKALDQIQKGN